MNSINSLVESANPWKSLQSDAARLAKKWSVTGLLEGTGNETNKNNMALLLENQAKQLVIETSQTGTGASFSSGTNGENWAGIALPLVRKVFGQIAAKEFVSVQPMNLPSGLVFFLDFQYGTTKNPFTDGNSMYGNRNPSSTYPFQTTAASGGLYGAGRFSYSENTFTGSVAYTASTANSSIFGTAAVSANSASIQSASWADVGFDSDFSASVASGTVYKITISSSMLTTPDIDGARSFLITSGGITAASNFPQFTKVDTTSFGATTAITFFVTSSANFTGFGTAGNSIAGGTGFIVTYNKQPNDNSRGDFESGSLAATTNNALSNPISIPEINIKMQSQPIVAKTRKLKAVWTPEFAQDLNAYQNLDAEAELTNIMSEYISMEIDLEILDMLITDAPASNTDFWSAINNTTYNGTTLASAASAQAFYNTQGQWFQTLGTKIQKISNKIHQLTLRGGANFMVMSPTVATILESIPGFASTSNGDTAQMEYAFGVQKVGSLNSRYNVYKNPYMTENVILLGFRGSQFLEAGAVFTPYIPLIMTPLVYDPETFTPRKGLLTRYAKKMLRPEFYGKIYVSGLNTI